MSKRIEIQLGTRFGKLVVEEWSEEKQKYKCKCDCNGRGIFGTIYVKSNALLSGHTQSCACVKYNRDALVSGQRFGKLEVICYDDEKLGWKCLCDCGKIKYYKGYELTKGKKSCGCLIRVLPNLENKRFDRLTVKEYIKERVQWRCFCDCGNETFVGTYALLKGKTHGCKCCHAEQKILPDDLGPKREFLRIYKRSASVAGREFLMDENLFFEKISKNCIYCGAPPTGDYKFIREISSFKCNGIDRINNNLPYSAENTVTCCARCNKAKATMTAQEFVDLCQNVVLNSKIRPTNFINTKTESNDSVFDEVTKITS